MPLAASDSAHPAACPPPGAGFASRLRAMFRRESIRRAALLAAIASVVAIGGDAPLAPVHAPTELAPASTLEKIQAPLLADLLVPRHVRLIIRYRRVTLV